MSNLVLVILMVVGGFAVALQPSFNARLAEKVGLIHSATISFAVGTVLLYALSLTVGQGNYRRIGEADWWQLTGGFFGAFFVVMTIVGVPRIGTTAVLALTIAAQLAAGVLLDHFGLFGMRGIPFDLKRALGIALLVLGTALIYKS